MKKRPRCSDRRRGNILCTIAEEAIALGKHTLDNAVQVWIEAVELWTAIVGNPGWQKAEKLAKELEDKEKQSRLLEIIKEQAF